MSALKDNSKDLKFGDIVIFSTGHKKYRQNKLTRNAF